MVLYVKTVFLFDGLVRIRFQMKGEPMLYGLMIAFVPLFLGYLFRVKHKTVLMWNNRLVTYCLYFILLIMGISLGQLDDLATKLPQIGGIALAMSVILHLCNIGFLVIYDKLYPMHRTISAEQKPLSRWRLVFDSLILSALVAIGGLVGFLMKGVVEFPLHSSTYVLVLMIFCVGVQLRNSGIPIRQVFLNRRGIVVSFIFMTSGLIGGIICSYLLGLPLVRSLALASGFGWYSLSSVLLNDAWGAVYGSIAFF